MLNGVVGTEIIFLEVLSVSERRSAVKIGLEGALHIWQFTFHGRVPVVLDRVICATFKYLSDLCPLVIHNAMHQEEDPLLLLAPVDFLYSWVQMVMPPFPALLAYAAV